MRFFRPVKIHFANARRHRGGDCAWPRSLIFSIVAMAIPHRFGGLALPEAAVEVCPYYFACVARVAFQSVDTEVTYRWLGVYARGGILNARAH